MLVNVEAISNDVVPLSEVDQGYWGTVDMMAQYNFPYGRLMSAIIIGEYISNEVKYCISSNSTNNTIQ